MAYGRRSKKRMRRSYGKKSSKYGYRKKNQGYMARSGKRAPLSSRGWRNITKGAKPELKYKDTEFQTSGTNTQLFQGLGAGGSTDTRYVRPCNLIAQGTDFNTRIGRKILIKSVYTRMTIYPNTANTFDTNATARIMLIWDLQPNGAALPPNLTDIFQEFASGSTRMNTNNMMNLNYRERFVVLWDKIYTLGYIAAAAANGQSARVVKKFKKVNLSVTYNNISDTVANIATGSLLLVSLGDAAVAYPQATGVVRIRFTDA